MVKMSLAPPLLHLFYEFGYGVSGISERYLEVSKVFFNLNS
jgi:hypothetical protein